MATPQLSVVTVGHVDHGKSTLIGRLLHDTGNLLDGKADELRAISERRGVPFEWSFVLDALQSERDQAITIDTTRIWMHLGAREIVLIDAPGHEEFLRNMVTGASDADAALLVVDAAEGVSEQTRRHALLLELIGIRQVIVAINKMDRVNYDSSAYEAVRSELDPLLARIGIRPSAAVPVVALDGDNVATESTHMPWYDGPTIVGAMTALEPIRRHEGAELRMAVQGVVRRGTERIVVGRIESGSIGVGDEVVLSPGVRQARVKSLEVWPDDGRSQAHAGESIGFTLDLPLFIERGDIVSDSSSIPASTTLFRARLLWLGRRALEVGDRLRMRVGTRLVHVAVDTFERIVDVATLQHDDARSADKNDVAEVVFRSRETLALDTIDRHTGLGRFILIDGLDVVAGGTILATFAEESAGHIVPVGHLLNREARAARNGHRGAVIWMTGLPAAGKSTIAMQLERRLHERGVQSYVLDGDNLRTGLCRDLGFSDRDRSENIRRVSEVATLFADAGVVAIAAFISPSWADREIARHAGGDLFHEVFVKADVSVCEARDPKGHYAQARAGDIPGFTGVTGKYEEPLNPELVIDTERSSLDACVSSLLQYVIEHITQQRTPLPSFAMR